MLKKYSRGGPLSLGVFVRKVGHKDRIFVQLGIQGSYRKLVILRHLDFLDVILLEQLLPPGKNGLQEVLVHNVLGRHVELETKEKSDK